MAKKAENGAERREKLQKLKLREPSGENGFLY